MLAAESPPQEKPSAAGSGGSGAAAPDYRAEVSEVHKQLIGSVKHLTQSLVAAASPPQEEAERSGKRGFGGRQPPTTARR